MTVVTQLALLRQSLSVDTTAPVFTYVPADYTTECSDEYVMDASISI